MTVENSQASLLVDKSILLEADKKYVRKMQNWKDLREHDLVSQLSKVISSIGFNNRLYKACVGLKWLVRIFYSPRVVNRAWKEKFKSIHIKIAININDLLWIQDKTNIILFLSI